MSNEILFFGDKESLKHWGICDSADFVLDSVFTNLLLNLKESLNLKLFYFNLF